MRNVDRGIASTTRILFNTAKYHWLFSLKGQGHPSFRERPLHLFTASNWNRGLGLGLPTDVRGNLSFIIPLALADSRGIKVAELTDWENLISIHLGSNSCGFLQSNHMVIQLVITKSSRNGGHLCWVKKHSPHLDSRHNVWRFFVLLSTWVFTWRILAKADSCFCVIVEA